MTENRLMTIGRFARISGLSVHTLRHYDDVGILTPAEVDSGSGYRMYRRDQVRDARLIQALRWIDLPVEETELLLAITAATQSRTSSADIAVVSSGGSASSRARSPTSTTSLRRDSP